MLIVLLIVISVQKRRLQLKVRLHAHLSHLRAKRQRRESRWAAKQFLLEEAQETGRQEASEDEGSCEVDGDGGNYFDGDEESDELGHRENQSTSGRKRYPDNRYPKNVPSPAVPLTRHL